MTWQPTLEKTHWPLTYRHTGEPNLYFDRPDPRVLRIPIRRPVSFAIAFMDQGKRYQVRVDKWRAESPGEYVGWATIPGTSLGVHAHHRVVTKDIRDVTIQVSNACVASTAFKGAVYFNAWSVAFDGGAETRSWSGPTSFFPGLASLTIRAGPSRAPITLGTIDAFGPSRTKIPVMTSADTGEYHTYGPWELMGHPNAYAHGGFDIYPFPRFLSVRDEQRAADGTAARQRACAYDAVTGEAYPASKWGLFEYVLARGNIHNQRQPYFSGGTVSDQWTEKRLNTGSCAYEAEIQTRRDERGYAAHDDAHLVRALLHDLALWYTTRDMIAWYRLQALAQDVMTAWRMTPIGPERPEYAGQYIPFSLSQRIAAAKANPGRGGDILRRVGWCMWAVAQVSWITPPGATKDYMLAWMRKMDELQGLVSPPNAIPYNGGHPWSDDGLPWKPENQDGGGFPQNWGDVPSWQIPIWAAGYDELRRALGLRSDASRSADNYLMGTAPYVPNKYNPASRGVQYYLRTTVNGAFDAPIAHGGGLSNPLHFRDHLARAYSATKDPNYLATAAAIDFPQPSVGALKAAVQNTQDPWLFRLRSVLS